MKEEAPESSPKERIQNKDLETLWERHIVKLTLGTGEWGVGMGWTSVDWHSGQRTKIVN